MTALTYEMSIEDEHNYYLNYDERDDMGSFNHSVIQLKLGSMLLHAGEYSVGTEMSIDVTSVQDQFPDVPKTYIVDIALYSRRPVNLNQDIIRMSDPPLLVVEILSPMQPPQHLLNKVSVYFALGVKSCWLISPAFGAISVYDAPDSVRRFVSGDSETVFDQTIGVTLPIDEIFR